MIFKLNNKNKKLSKLTDEQLISSYKAEGNSVFAGELFNRYVHLVYGICLKYTKHKEESKDIAMTVFEKMLAHLPSTEIQLFKKWLYTITKNQCISYLRERNKKVDQPVNREELENKLKNFVENEDFLSPINEELKEQRIQAALKKLKPDQKRCLYLFYFKAMSYKEIEEKTDYTEKQVKSFLQNGKRNLRLILESEKIGFEE